MNRRFLTVAALCGLLVAPGCTESSSPGDTTTASTTASTPAASVVEQHVFEVEHFASGAIIGDVTTEDCTLSGGTTTTCARVTVAGYPASYSVGPFCPETITTPAADAGIWFDGTDVYDLDGAFVKDLAALYGDSEWKLYDDAGNVNVTDTKEAFEGAARPDVDPEYQNHCVEGQLAWLPDGEPIQTTMLIPLQPVKASQPSSAHPGNLGITFDGVVLAESAPVDAILGAHTIAAFDDCGGHYNPAAGYHVHGVTGCGHLEGVTSTGETEMFGYAADGYPIHLPLESAALAGAGLDACNGHSTVDEGYHYHAQSASKNAILPCLMGEYVMDSRAGGPPPGGPPADGEDATGAPAGGLDLQALAAELGVTRHELEDALATGDLDAAAELLGTTSAAIAQTLGVPVADLQAAFLPRSHG